MTKKGRRNNIRQKIWWDLENTPILNGYEPLLVYKGIKRSMEDLGFFGPLSIEAVAVEDRVPMDILRRLRLTGISFIPANHSGSQASDDKIGARIKDWLAKRDTEEEVVAFIMTGDKDFKDDLDGFERAGLRRGIICNEDSVSHTYFAKNHYLLNWSTVLERGRGMSMNSHGLPPYRARKDRERSVNWDEEFRLKQIVDKMDQGRDEFTAWECLIRETEESAKDRIRELRIVFDGFLSRFPLCSAYWKKYAEHESRLGSSKRVLQVYRTALVQGCYSVDIWLLYCDFALETYGDAVRIREYFWEAFAHVGVDYRSKSLWSKFLDYEKKLERDPIYRDGSYAAWIHAEILKAQGFTDKIVLGKRMTHLNYSPGPIALLDRVKWHNLLDFVESYKGVTFNQVYTEYEKCLVVCANYPEFWIRYIFDMKSRKRMDIVDSALSRATQLFLKNQPEIHILDAQFKEQRGDIGDARDAYYLVHHQLSPGHLEAVIKNANMERRLENTNGAFLVYEHVIAVEKGKDKSTLLPLLYAQYSRFSYLVKRDAVKARKIIVEALDHVQPSKLLLETLIHCESIQPPPRQIDYLEPLVEKVIKPNADTQNSASSTEREELSLIYIEFLGLLGDVKSFEKAENKHAKLFLPHRSTSELKKRSADDFLSSDRTKIAETYNGTPPAQPVINAYPNAQAQWSGGYAAQPQTWSPAQAAPAQPQQWNPAYGQQNQLEMHLFAARLKEQNGDITGARAAFQLLHSEVSPVLLEAVIKHANMERRLGNMDEAFSVYEQAIAVEKGKENSTLLPVLYAQYSRFSYLVYRDADKAKNVIVDALAHVQQSKPLLEALIHFESIKPPPRVIGYLEPLVERFIDPNADTQNPASLSEREELSAIYIEFLGLLGNMKSFEKAENKHAKLFLPHRSTLELKKRSADDFLSSDRTKIAKTHNGTPPAPPVTNAYPNAQAQWSGGYAAQPQTWPQVQAAPAQPQQWNPAYGQQAAYPHAAAYGAYPAQTYPSYEPAQAQPQQLNPTYGQEAYGGYSAYGAYGGDPAYGAYPAQAAYGGYPAGYTAPQAPSPVPQAAAYGAYPAQTYPEQSYAAPVATVAPVAAPVQQAYYNTYY